MSNPMLAVGGLLMVAFASMIFTFALPSLDQATTTGVGTPYENASTFTASAIGMTNQFVMVFPAMMFMVGLGLVFVGIKGG